MDVLQLNKEFKEIDFSTPFRTIQSYLSKTKIITSSLKKTCFHYLISFITFTL